MKNKISSRDINGIKNIGKIIRFYREKYLCGFIIKY